MCDILNNTAKCLSVHTKPVEPPYSPNFEAQLLVSANVDAIVAQGIEAGGHRGTFSALPIDDKKMSTLSLVSELCKEIDLPIIAAGGISNKEGVNKALAIGAQACQIGTAFLSTYEAGTHTAYKHALLNPTSENTILTRALSGRFARGIRNKLIETIEAHKDEILPFPIQNKLTGQIRAAAAEQNNPEFMSLWAGQNFALCEDISAAELMRRLIS